jgi:hypothetical protein
MMTNSVVPMPKAATARASKASGMRKVSVGSLDAVIRHTQADDRSRRERAGQDFYWN